MAKQILTRIKDELKAMQQSRDQEYIQTEINGITRGHSVWSVSER